MFSKILSVLSLARHAVAITLVTGAATAMVAGSVDVSSGAHPTTNVTAAQTTMTSTSSKNTNEDLEALVKACLATKDMRSADCAQAIDRSGVSAAEFWANLALSLNERLGHEKKAEPKAEPTKKPDTTEPSHTAANGQLIYLVAACVESHERSSAMCQAALEASGLSADEFFAKVAIRFGRPIEPTTKPSDKPGDKGDKPVSTESISMLIKDCLTKYAALRTSNEGGTAASDACKKAIEASGLSSSDFWARFGPKTTNTEPTRKPEPTTKPATTTPTEQPKPSATQSVSDEQLAAMVKDCFAKYQIAKDTHEGGTAAYEACTKAITASGLGADAFWKKFGYPGAASN